MKKIRSAESFFHVASFFAEVLARQRRLVKDTAGVTVAHIEAFRDRYDGLRSQGSYVDTLRSLLRDDPELPQDVRAALVQARVPSTPDAEAPTDREYADAAWQQLMTALRSDVRIARDRIRAGRDLLHRLRADPLRLDGEERQVGRLLDGFDRTGEFPRYRGGAPTNEIYAAGGAASLAARLCLTLHEMTAFALLLTALTGENFGTVAAWPAAHYRPDGRNDSTGIALVEAVKPRRGPEHEHMILALEDLPAGLAEVLTASDDHSRLWRSPLQVYHLLLELTQVSRRHGGHSGVFSAYTPHPGRFGSSCWVCGVGAHQVRRWARHHGFPPAAAATEVGRPPIDVRRIRQTVIQRRRRPVAHTRRTMNDQYLLPSRRVQHDSKAVVAAALHDEVDKARTRQRVPVFTGAFVARAHTDPQGAAAAVGLEPETLKRLLSGDQDTALASCTDHLASPHTAAGEPCPASFLACLDCDNARALPHQLPVQIAAADRIAALRPHLDPAVWRARLQPRLQQLNEITSHYTPSERDRARRQVTDPQWRMVDELLQGRWELR